MKKRILAVLLAAAMVLTVLPTFTLSVAAEEERYLDYVDGAFTAKPLPSPLNVIDEATDPFVTGWNIVRGSVEFNNRITLPKDVNLILADGATLTAKKGITVASDGGFAIYAQSTDEATMGKLTAPGSNGGFNAAIGAPDSGVCGNITIYGGAITAKSEGVGAGIGASWSGSCGDIAIYGGVVNAPGNTGSAGIGSGYNNSSCGNITISGGVVNAQSIDNAAGIGSGYYHSSCGTITISGGVVNAQGGDSGAGIGSGFVSDCGTITISGGVVNAQGGRKAAGIGSGFTSSCGAVTITGGYVCATGGEKAQPIGKGCSSSSPTTVDTASCVTVVKDGATYLNYEPLSKTEPDCVTSGTAAYYKDYVSGNYYAAFPFTEDGCIGDDAALAAWKTSGAGYIPPLGHVYEYLDFFQHVCARCGDVSGHDYHNNACRGCGITVSVKYYDYNATSKQFLQVTIDPYMDELQGVCSSDTDVEIDGGYYVVFGNVTVNGTLTVSDDTDLILGDGATLTVTNGVVLDGGDLSVYAQTLDTAKMGSLVVTATSANKAAIGGDGDLVMNGGVITATGAANAAGIGSNAEGACGNITFNGGVITANGGTGAAGIGCGVNGTCGTVTVGENLSLFAGNAADSLAYCAAYSDEQYAQICKGIQTAAVSPTCFGVGCKAYIQNTADALYYEMSDSGVKIGDAEALAAWKAEGGAGYIAIVDHDWVAVDENGHKCTYCEDVQPHTYVNAPYICDACGYEDLKTARADAKAAFDEAAGENPTDAMKTVLSSAKSAVDAAETVAAVTAAKETWLPVVELRLVKDTAIAAVNTAAGETPSAAVQAGVHAAENLINAAETAAEVESVKTAVLPVITALVEAEAEAAAQTLADAKAAAKAALTDAAGDEPSEALAVILSDACDAVDEAATVAAVQTAEEAGFAAIMAQLAAEANAAKQAVEEELAQAEEDLAAANDTISELNDTISALNDTVKSKDATIAEKQAALDTATEQLNAAKADLEKAQADLETAKANIEELEGTVDEQDEALKQAAKDLEDKQAALDEMTANYNEAKAALDDTKKALDEATAANEQLQQDLAAANEALKTANDTVAALNDTVASKDATIAEKQAAIEAAQKALDEAKAQVTALEGTVSEQDEALAQAEQEIKDLQAEIERLKALLDDDPTDPQPTDPTDPTEKLLGDANGDGAVNMKDVLLMRKFLAGVDVEYNAQNADCNEDGDVNMKDVLLLRKFLAGAVTELGA